MKEFIINQNDGGQRIDKFIEKLCPSMPRAMLYKSIRKECVRLNGKHIKDGSERISAGDTVRLYIKDEFFEKKKCSPISEIPSDIDIIYEDENIMLINKPEGTVVQDDGEGEDIPLYDMIKSYLIKKGEYRPKEENTFSPALCNRLDRNTGGIVIAAKNAEALRIMNEKIKKRELEKKYLLIALGCFKKKKDEVTAYLFKDEKQKRVYIYDSPKPGTKTIITRYRVLAEREDMSLVEAELVTGRTHQIRAQMAKLSHPILGDGKYGINSENKKYSRFHQALYAYRLTFRFTTDPGALSYLDNMEFVAPMPEFVKKYFGDITYPPSLS